MIVIDSVAAPATNNSAAYTGVRTTENDADKPPSPSNLNPFNKIRSLTKSGEKNPMKIGKAIYANVFGSG